ncbi:MAG: SulP family inorganic anion transporter [Sphingobacteriaceae bacterium]|nr:SulP family inorganic anion transporter [Sphingobacteriaceae bacterium]
MSKRSTIALFKSIPTNLFAGFVVSLVALPLGLGLAIASGAPPISGVISAIVGGIIVSVLGGGNVTITGPGNGLVVAVLGAITVLGNGNLQEGYLYALAAIIFSGVIITILSFIKIGNIGNFFSAPALQGMLSAIGIIIISKQAHIMLGNLDSHGNTLHLLAKIPESLVRVFTNENLRAPATAGLLSLAIMFFYSTLRNKYFHLVPAPMWIVIISVSFAYYIQSQPNLEHPLEAKYLLNIPNDALSNFPKPNFSKITNYTFILAVLSITLIASIESILSIKAIDKLDPKKRHSSTDKELRALGIATIVSGFLGGLNVVTVIARSSVNVNNGGTNKFANLFHAIFLLLFIFLFQEQLKHIPYPALAAILVATGYKLASPNVFIKMFKIGRPQFIIFLITLVSTLTTNLISGILIGTLATLLIHVILAKSFVLFFRYLFTNNISIHELEGNRILITVKYYCSFLNFFRLKNAIDKIGDSKEIIVDFKQCKFVDHTVLESLNMYEDKFGINDVEFKLIGIESKHTSTSHPFALRRVLQFVPFIDVDARQSKRIKLLEEFTNELHWTFVPEINNDVSFLNHFHYFQRRQASYYFNTLANANSNLMLFDIEYSEGAFIAREDVHSTIVYIKVPLSIPAFTLEKKDLFERLSFLAYSKEIEINAHRDFSSRFVLRGKRRKQLKNLFSEELLLFFECNHPYHIEADGKGGVIVMDREHAATIGEIKTMTDFCIRLQQIINEYHSSDEKEFYNKEN